MVCNIFLKHISWYSAGLINIYRNRHRIDARSGLNDPAVATGISDLLNNQLLYPPPAQIVTGEPLVAGLSDGLWTGNAPTIDLVCFIVDFKITIFLQPP